MSCRLPEGGRRIDRSRRLDFTFDGRALKGFEGDTLASALIGSGMAAIGRSSRDGAARGVLGTGRGEAEIGLSVAGADGLALPGASLAMPLQQGMGVTGPDAGRPDLVRALSFLFGSSSAGGRRDDGTVPVRPKSSLADGVPSEILHYFADILVVGGGIAGLQAAVAAGAAGAKVLLLERAPRFGGRAPADGVRLDGVPAGDWIATACAQLERMANVRLRPGCEAVRIGAQGLVFAQETAAGDGGDCRRLWKIGARQVILATGGTELPLCFPGNGVPGVMLASAVRDLLFNHAVTPGRRVAVSLCNDGGYRTALALHRAGVAVACIADLRGEAQGPLAAEAAAAGLRVAPGMAITGIRGRRRVKAARIGAADGDGKDGSWIACDAVAVSGGWAPEAELLLQAGGTLWWDESRAMFRPDPEALPAAADGTVWLRPAGQAAGHAGSAEVLRDAALAAAGAVAALGLVLPDRIALPAAPEEEEGPAEGRWLLPSGASPALLRSAIFDFGRDLSVADLPTLGRGPCRASGIGGAELDAEALARGVPLIRSRTGLADWAEALLPDDALPARPVLRTPLHGWHAAHGAAWEEAGPWLRPESFPRGADSGRAALLREAGAARQGAALADVSPVGKLLVAGPDAGRFLDMAYAGSLGTLPPGFCRYALACGENGAVLSGGMVARIDEQTWLCHASPATSARFEAHLRRLLEQRWPGWQVFAADIVGQFAQIALAGPGSRAVLAELAGEIELSDAALPVMHWRDRQLCGIPVRLFRYALAGGLGYEIAVAPSRAPELWHMLAAAGAVPCGTAALRALRIGRGFAGIGRAAALGAAPQDLGLGRAVSPRKADYIGKAAHGLPAMADPSRPQLAGLLTPDGAVLPEGSVAAADGARVMASCWSPVRGRGIALGLVPGGARRSGELLDFDAPDGRVLQARITGPVFHAAEEARADG
ncbi:FAD-dependent oxidoreductase [Mangrovicoccus sp. HB161399]|uniref:FAD-dependent oxidoreductase n=1 Tax=Mangrovicoccus sp. HB161399 TaxID=2720392 RepID=UPI0015530BC2